MDELDDKTLNTDGISRFEIREHLGEGGMGVVFRARDAMLQRDIALKVIKPQLAEDRQVRSRFLRECQTAAAINHPSVATIYEAGEDADGKIYLASEFIPGETLKRRLERGPIPTDEVIDLGLQIAQGLAAAHAAGIVHRDVKPANLMVMEDGRLKILDFGLARLNMPVDPDSQDDGDTLTQTRAGAVLGTPAYMSPEQATGMRVDARTDVFACGCVLYEMASGRSPFSSDSVSETMRRLLSEEPPPLDSVAEGILPGLAEVIRTALAKNPGDRYADAGELAEALEAARGTAAGTPSVGGRSWSRAIRRPRTSAAALLLIALAVLLTWFWNRPTLAFMKKDRLLITSVDNRSDEEAFDLALRTALEADLQQSPYVNVFQHHQVAEVMRLMRLDPSAPVNEELGRDICRFAGVRALLVPRILAVGEAYELQAILVDPISGRHVDRIRVTALGREEVLLNAIDELSRLVRSRLGETIDSIEEADLRIAKVMTSSWEALKYLSMSNDAWGEGDFDEAAALLELALEKDPSFASAKGSLGLLLIQFKGETERGKQLLREALVDSEDLPETEYLMVRAVNKQFVEEDFDAALAEYELICELYPDHMPAHNNRGRMLLALGRASEAIPMFERAAELDQTSTIPLLNLWFIYTGNARDPAGAEEVALRLVDLAPHQTGFRTMLGWSYAIAGRFDEALAETRRVVESEPHHEYGLPNMAHLLYVTGADEEAVPYYRTIHELTLEGTRSGTRWATARDLAVALVSSGLSDEAWRLVEDETAVIRTAAQGSPLDVDGHLGFAGLLAVVGRDGEARDHLERAFALGVEDPVRVLSAAQAFASLGDLERALAGVEHALEIGAPDLYLPSVTPALRPLRSDPRFIALFRSPTHPAGPEP